jgi:dipeptidyl aminopeptidase/acylaminoacyl peptidase
MRPAGWVAVAAAAAAALALPAAAGATLAYVKAPLNPAVYAAADNGSGAHRLGPGTNPRVSPDGESVAYLRETNGGAQELKLAPAAGGASRTLITDLRESFYLTFSPDSKTIAALRGPEIGKRKLVLIDVASGSERVVATGFFSGFSFSPEGDELVYARANNDHFPAPSDLYRASTSGGKAARLTRNHVSLDPLWGPNGRIVFVKQLGAKKRRYGPKNELFLIDPNGKGLKRLTHTKVDPLLQGLYPTEWSANGSHLLAEFEGQDTSYAVTVNPRTGAQRALDRRNQGESGFVGTAISRDGSTVLGYTGGFDPGSKHNVATFPYGGRKAKVLVKNAFSPDWSR